MTLGRLEIVGGNLTRPKPLAVLTYLCVEGRQERRHVAELFWPGHDRARNNLNTTLSRIRDSAPGSISGEAGVLWGCLDTDVGSLEQALAASDLERIAALYRGPFLHGAPTARWGVEFETWVVETRESIAIEVRAAYLRGARQALAGGRPDDAVDLAERAYRVAAAPEPGPEELQAFHAYFSRGSEGLRREVEAELEAYGIEAAATPAGMARAPAIPRGPSPAPPPRAITPFVGRAAELAELRDLIDDPAFPLATVVGIGGSGKTRLAAEAATRWGSDDRTVAFATLESTRSDVDVAAQVASAVGARWGHEVEDVATALGSDPALMVLDNAEHVLGPVRDIVRHLIERCPGLTIVVTSRRVLEVPGEARVILEGLPVGDEHAPGSAVTMLRKLFQRRSRDGSSVNDSVLRMLAEVAGGLPIALELMASWAHVMSPEEILSRVRSDPFQVESADASTPERFRVLEHVLRTSIEVLPESSRGALERLSPLRGGFDHVAARAMGVSFRALSDLVNSGLVTRTGGRFERHPLVSAFARRRARSDEATWTELRDRHARHFLDRIRAQADALLTAGSAGSAELFDTDLANVRDALRWAVRRADTMGEDDVLFAYGTFNMFRGDFGLPHDSAFKQELHELARGRVKTRVLLDVHEVMRGGVSLESVSDETLAALRQATEQARAHADAGLEAVALCYLGIGQAIRGDEAAARHSWESSRNTFRALGDRRNILETRFHGAVLNNLAELEAAGTNYRRCDHRWLRSISLQKRAGLAPVYSLVHMSMLHGALGDFDRALRVAEGARACLVRGSMPLARVVAYRSCGDALIALSRNSEARTAYEAARAAATELRGRARDIHRARVLRGLATAYVLSERSQRAREVLSELNDGPATSLVWGIIERSRGRTERAERRLNVACEELLGESSPQAWTASRLATGPVWKASARMMAVAEWAALVAADGDVERAQMVGRAACAGARRRRAWPALLHCCVAAALVDRRRGNRSEAADLLQRVGAHPRAHHRTKHMVEWAKDPFTSPEGGA